MHWDDFEAVCPEIAQLGRRRFADDELVMVGTLRADGTPRISATEPDIVLGRLMLGMIWQSTKAFDLLRDPRVTVHTVPSDRLNPRGDIKLTGLAEEETSLDARQAYREALKARIDWAPDEPDFHVFSIDIIEAAYIRFGDDPLTQHWDPARGLRILDNPG